MAIAVIGGVISSTLLSLVVVPVFYLTIENIKGWLGRRNRGSRGSVPHGTSPASAGEDEPGLASAVLSKTV
jgi:hypothetical protein